MVSTELELNTERITVCGIEVDSEFKQTIIEAISMRDLPYTVQIHKSKHHEAAAWCRKNLGPRCEVTGNRQGTWCCFWAGRENYSGYNYHFAREQDMVWFSLKWI